MLTYTDLKKGILFILDGNPYEVVESSFSRMQQRKAVVQAKIRNLKTGKLIERSFQPSDQFVEADIKKRTLLFLYSHRGEYVFIDPPANQSEARPDSKSGRQNRANRFSLAEDIIGDKKKWLKPNTEVTAVFFEEKFLTFSLPIKMDLKVVEAPPGVQGDRATQGTKSATLETGVIVQVPPFINEGDMIRVNTETGNYAERVEKGTK